MDAVKGSGYSTSVLLLLFIYLFTFVIADREVGLPGRLLRQAEEEAVSFDWLIQIRGAHRLYPLETDREGRWSEKTERH